MGDLVVTGVQDDPVTVHDSHGSLVWSRPGVWTDDDVRPIDDGAVFALEWDDGRLGQHRAGEPNADLR